MSDDPRLTLARPDLADAGLEGLVRAEAFGVPTSRRLIVPSAPVRADARLDAEQVDQLLFGEHFITLEFRDGFAWGQAVRDGYVGWVEAATLSGRPQAATHRVAVLRTFAFAEASIKSPARGPFSLNALFAVTASEGLFSLVDGAGWVATRHLAEVGRDFQDPVDVAERFLGAPYLWGGRDSLGLDCSGLVQQAFYAAGRSCPRDSYQQATLGVAVAPVDLTRGDLVFWRGHVGIMLDGRRLLHANAYHMAVAAESFAEAAERIAAGGGGDPIAFRRP